MQIPMERRTQLLMSFSCIQKWLKEKQNQNQSVQGSDYETLGLRSAASLLNVVNTLKPTFSNAGKFVFRHLSLKTSGFHFCASLIPAAAPWEKSVTNRKDTS